MSVRYYLCQIYGNGDPDVAHTPTTGPYRPAISDVIDPATGLRAFERKFSIGVDPQTGQPLTPWVLVAARSDKHRLLDGHADIVHVADAGVKDVQIGAIDIPKRVDTLAMLSARGVDLSGFDNSASHRQIMDKVVADADPAMTLDDIDFPD